MGQWKIQIRGLTKITNQLLQLIVESSKLPERDIVAKSGLVPQYREMAEILFEARVKTNQPLPEGWIHTA
ncbi:hypothetical protein, partial [Enterobacter cloacae complex sp. 4DZ3-17B2]|uniref:hypothetical protein n=1 Tax=Enterobacter cloacae complex sp. 4DZ3-17B2 TaxID=2511990 RepID=UPI001CA4B4F1